METAHFPHETGRQRRARFNAAMAEFVAWMEAHPLHAQPSARQAHELWDAYETYLRAAFEGLESTVFWAGVQPKSRPQLARDLALLAWTRLQVEPFPDVHQDQTELRLWTAALGCSRQATALWEQQVREERGNLGFGFATVEHRVADLYRRAERTDFTALRLYVRVYTGDRALPVSHMGPGGQISPNALLQRGAAIQPEMPREEKHARANICAQLLLRGHAAPWVRESLELASAEERKVLYLPGELPATSPPEALVAPAMEVTTPEIAVSEEPETARPARRRRRRKSGP